MLHACRIPSGVALLAVLLVALGAGPATAQDPPNTPTALELSEGLIASPQA